MVEQIRVDFDPERTPPTPVVGMLGIATFLFLLEALLELLVIHSASVNGLTVPAGAWGIPEVTIAFGLLLLLLTFAYLRRPSGILGLLFLVLGGLSFLIGAGFLVGGILVIVAGALACFWDGVEDRLWALATRTRAMASGLELTTQGGRLSTPSLGHDAATTSGPQQPSPIGYSPCPVCGELNRLESASCISCGKHLPLGQGGP
jgi:hypothetical protein